MILAWQGWQLDVPDRWAPVKIEGDESAGFLLMADLHRPRLGIRWKLEKGKRFDAAAAAARTMKDEVGVIAAAEAGPAEPGNGKWLSPILYEEPEPPGRDVWVGYSQDSRRMFQVVYHAHHRDRVLRQRVLPKLVDGSERREWSVFDLSCRTPAGYRLLTHRLNAGDLALMFTGPKRQAVTVRQIAVAKLALQRRPLERWILEQANWRGRQFRVDRAGASEGSPRLVRRRVVRRLQFSWMWWLARGYLVLARHDERRDRLVFVDATDEKVAEEVMASVGWAGGLAESET